jgi:two-component system LytT family sensor kinase
MLHPLHPVLSGRQKLLRRGGELTFISLFWGLQFASLTVQRAIAGAHDDASLLPPRLCVTMAAIFLSFLIARGHERLSGRLLRTRLIAAVLFAFVAALAHGAANYAIFALFLGERSIASATLQSYTMALFEWFWSYAAVSGLLLAFAYSLEMSRLQHLAQGAQLRALRYQLNPHFMFNTLNSIAALISEGKGPAAERTVESLADFLRASLAIDPEEDIPLEREVLLQALYLEIEGVRFADRLRSRVVVPPDVAGALVPSLITQPLAENMIRHAVANTVRPVEFVLSARREDGNLRVSAYNSAPDAESRSRRGDGTGIGLANVAERLQARFGNKAWFAAGRQEDGGFLAEFVIPFTTGSAA